MVPEYKTKIGFIFGLKKEMDLLKYRHPEILYSHGYGELSKQATKKLIDSGVGFIINIGLAGSISPKINHGDIILVNSIFDENKNEYKTNQILKKIKRNLKKFNFKKCNLLTVDKIITREKEKKSLALKFKEASIIDMEAFHIKRALTKKKIKMVSLKVIFDDLSFQIPCFLKDCIDEIGNVKKFKFFFKIIVKPARLFTLLDLMHKFSKSEKVLKKLINCILT